jgi:putative cell wall-binding protein
MPPATFPRRAFAIAAMLALALTGPQAPAAGAAAGLSMMVVSEFDGSGDWFLRAGPGTLTTVASPKTSGTAALKIAYNFNSGTSIAIGQAGTPPELPGLPRRLSLDVYGDGSWHTVYFDIRDATGEILRYWVGNINFSNTWQTMSVELGKIAPIDGNAGDLDTALDLTSQSVYQLVLYKNSGGTKMTGSVYFDHLTYEYEPDGVPAVTPDVFVPSAGESGTVSINLVDAGDVSLTATDEAGRTRTWSATGVTSWSTSWDGRTAGGAVMSGAVSAALTVTRGTSSWHYQITYFAGLPARTEGKLPSMRGVNVYATEIDTSNRARVIAMSQKLEAAYAGMVREEFEWKRVEASDDVFDWPKFDQAVEIERAHGFQILGKLVYCAPWASSAPAGTPASVAQFYAPKSNAEFAEYARAVVHRYKDRVHVWQIWNEENYVATWKPSPNAAAYTGLLKAAYAAIKAEDPTAQVVLGGLSTGPDASYLAGIYANGGWGSFDILAVHTFVATQPDGSAMERWFDAAKAAVAQYGYKPIWITEFGWSSYTGSGSGYIGVTEGAQGAYLARSYQLAQDHGMAAMIWFELNNRNTDPASEYGNYGMLRQNLADKPAYPFFKCMAMAIATETTPICSQRIAGTSRFATAAAISKAVFSPGVGVAYIASAWNFPDALAGAAAAGTVKGPILLVDADAPINSATTAELTRLKPAKIIVLGGPPVVSDEVARLLESYAPTVVRYSGADRYSTAADISFHTFSPGVPIAYVAYAFNFPDALAAAAAAGTVPGPILLADTNGTLNASTAAELDRLDPQKIAVLGSSLVLSDDVLDQLKAYSAVVERYSGSNRFATAAAISAKTFSPGVPVVYLANAYNFPDALAGAAAAGTLQGPVLLADTTGALNPATAAELDRLNPQRIYVLGSASVVSDACMLQAMGYVVPQD